MVPVDPVAEKCLVCGAILDPSTIPAICANAGGEPGFYFEANASIFATARKLHDSGSDADGAAVLTQLEADGKLEAVGGRRYLANVLESTFSGVNWPHYLRLVTNAARKRGLLNACESTIWRINNGRPIEECLVPALDGVSSAANAAGAPKDVPLADAGAGVLADLEAGRPSVIPIGLPSFDEQFGGIPTVGVSTFLGVPGSGKSSLVAGLALRIAEGGRGVRVFSYEMSAHSVTANLLSARAEVCVNECLRTGRVPSATELYKVAGVVDSFAGIDLAFVEELLTAREIENRAALYASRGVGCVVVDYIQNLPPAEPGQGDVARIEEGCRIMQRISRKYGMCVLVVSQMTGSSAREDRAPRKSDGIGSAAIDQVSDCTIGVYRPVVFTPRGIDEPELAWAYRKRQAQIHVLKNKKGPTGAVDVIFQGQYTRFVEVEGAMS